MNSTIKNLSNFSIFLNFFLFILDILQNNNVNDIPITFGIGSLTIHFHVNLLVLVIAIAVILGVVALSGSNIFGTGQNDTATSLVSRIIAYIVLWLIISLFTLTYLQPLQVFGDIIYGLLTLFYVMGFLSEISGNGGA